MTCFETLGPPSRRRPVYDDTPFRQDWSECAFGEEAIRGWPTAVGADRNGIVQVLARGRLWKPAGDTLAPQRDYRPLADTRILAMEVLGGDFFYLTPEAVLSNTAPGATWVPHPLGAAATHFAGDGNGRFLVGTATTDRLAFVDAAGPVREVSLPAGALLRAIRFDRTGERFWVLTDRALLTFAPGSDSLECRIEGERFTDLVLTGRGRGLIATENGYRWYDDTRRETGPPDRCLPCPRLTCAAIIDDRPWLGSERGAFRIGDDGLIHYYASRRWLPDDAVRAIAPGPDGSVLILTATGLATIRFRDMTLADKAAFFERQVRRRHVRYGFLCDTYRLKTPGELASGTLVDSDNDGLWTSMYLASQVFRYAVTGAAEARRNAAEAFAAMERLHTINPIPGFPARSFERHGYKLHDPDRWHETDDGRWDWKGTTSSDEAVGHYFAFALVAELLGDPDLRERAIRLIAAMTDHILEHDLYFVDRDGRPTRWARWNPEYVNRFPPSVGDRKLNSSNIIAFLQTAYHFTGREAYREKAVELMEKHDYLENLTRPMAEIGPTDGDALTRSLSSAWNHSDDEMYFLSYWCLYPYAFHAELRERYRAAIADHWQSERPEKNALWNFCYAMTGAEAFDLEESIWFLQEFPLDLIDWTVTNSHRQDIERLPPNFRNQTTKRVLPPDERPVCKHNTNAFLLDRDGGGRAEKSGDLYLLPYWMGRWLGIISSPAATGA